MAVDFRLLKAAFFVHAPKGTHERDIPSGATARIMAISKAKAIHYTTFHLRATTLRSQRTCV